MAAAAAGRRAALESQMQQLLAQQATQTAQATPFLSVVYPQASAPLLQRSTAADLLVLDSSFNPPTLAHASLLSASRRLVPPSTPALLLFATHNMDKGAGAGTPLLDRLDLMAALADDLSDGIADVAHDRPLVALTDQGRFTDKLRVIQSLLAAPRSGEGELSEASGVPARVHFIVGLDTLVRVFNPKYYSTSAGSSSNSSSSDSDDGVANARTALSAFFDGGGRFVCADRFLDGSGTLGDVDQTLRDAVRAGVVAHTHAMHVQRIPDWTATPVADVSSTLVRRLVGEYWAAEAGDSRDRLMAALRSAVGGRVLDAVLARRLFSANANQ
ncbi:hypothetical protein BC831DRAFT_555226 [Entophlyctis helioformis]|nr:hypothetical protein BC831DRAFT_555226 [Entophlyctis helioformis]